MSVRDLYIFIGPPGSGKGSLAFLCVRQLGVVQLSTGNLCRQEIAQKSDLGKQIDFLIKSGKLISDHIIARMVKEAFIRDCALSASSTKGLCVILDGFPRTVAQAEELNMMLDQGMPLVANRFVIAMRIAEQTVFSRLASRLICPMSNCQAIYSAGDDSCCAALDGKKCHLCYAVLVRRNDDRGSTIRQRLHDYYAHEKLLLDYYAQRKGYSIHDLSMEQCIDGAFADFKRIVGSNQV